MQSCPDAGQDRKRTEPQPEQVLPEDRLDPAQLDGANMQCDDSALSAPVDTPQVPLLLKAADSTSPLHPSYSSLAVSELQHKDDKPNKMAAIPEHRASPPALRIKTSLPSTPKKEDEKEAFSSPLTPSDDEEIPAVLAHDTNNAANEQVLPTRELRTRLQQPCIPEADGTDVNADGSDEEQALDELVKERVESPAKGKKRKGKGGFTAAAKRQKTKAAVAKPATKPSSSKGRKGAKPAKD